MTTIGKAYSMLCLTVEHVAPILGINSCLTNFDGQWVRLPLSIWPGFKVRYEEYIAQLLRENLEAGSVFIDIGAHIGFWSLFAEKLIKPSGCVIAFEASPPVFKQLSKSVCYSSRVRAYNVGLSNHEGVSAFYALGLATTASFVQEVTQMSQELNPDKALMEAQVPMRRLDSLLTELDVIPSVIKVDVEGYELEVLRGAGRILRDYSCVWIVEVHPPQLALSGGTEAEVQEIFASSGYFVDIVDRNPNSLYTIVAKK